MQNIVYKYKSVKRTRRRNDVGPCFDKLFGDGSELRDALCVVDEAVGIKDAAVAVVGVRAQADVAGDEEVRKAS